MTDVQKLAFSDLVSALNEMLTDEIDDICPYLVELGIAMGYPLNKLQEDFPYLFDLNEEKNEEDEDE